MNISRLFKQNSDISMGATQEREKTGLLNEMIDTFGQEKTI